MISRAARNIAYFFVEKKIISPNEKEIYAYGYEIMLSETINWIITICIMLLTGRVMETVVYMIAFMHLRWALGGFHANSHWGCIMISAAVYIVFLYIVHTTPMDVYWVLIISGLCLHMGLVFTIAPVAHTNKPFISESEHLRFRNKSRVLSIIYGAVCITLLISTFQMSKTFSYCILLGMLSASISMLVEYIKQQSQIKKKGGVIDGKIKEDYN